MAEIQILLIITIILFCTRLWETTLNRYQIHSVVDEVADSFDILRSTFFYHRRSIEPFYRSVCIQLENPNPYYKRSLSPLLLIKL
ncbi:hypothetical protein BLOT_013394 [Blomia tropicalis]|nr:hypothetical protein BLOT_013394 [Blomia tropicalis]